MWKLNEQNFYKLIKLSSKPEKATADTKSTMGKLFGLVQGKHIQKMNYLAL